MRMNVIGPLMLLMCLSDICVISPFEELLQNHGILVPVSVPHRLYIGQATHLNLQPLRGNPNLLFALEEGRGVTESSRRASGRCLITSHELNQLNSETKCSRC